MPINTSMDRVLRHRLATPLLAGLLPLALTCALCPPARAQTGPVARGLHLLLSQKVPGFSTPHANVVNQLRKAAGGKLPGKVYVVHYGSKAALALTEMMRGSGFGVIYKGSSRTGHTMAWVGGKFTDAVPGSRTFADGSKTRFHDFAPYAERPQLVAAFQAPEPVLLQARRLAEDMAHKRKESGADCSGYVCELSRTTSGLTQKLAPGSGLARLGQHLRGYMPPTALRNASLKEADAVILMTAAEDWRSPAHASYNINDWNGK